MSSTPDRPTTGTSADTHHAPAGPPTVTTPRAGAAAGAPVAVVEGLTVRLTRGDDVVDGIDLVLAPGQVLGLVGESGSGKTTVGTALLGHARRGAAVTDGHVVVAGHDLRALTPDQVRAVRGVDVAYVPQDPSSALNPAIRIGAQLRELLDLHDIGPAAERDARVREALPMVGLPCDDEFLARYPHQLSGGQVQRVALAMVFLPRPQVLVLDEPTTGLDVTTQDMVLATLARLCERFGTAALYVTHDLAVVARVADRVAVMYAGRVVEEGAVADVFAAPAHPYTRALLRAIPALRTPIALTGIPGRAPSPGRRPPGCRFSDRCPDAVARCTEVEPELLPVGTPGGAGSARDAAGTGDAGAAGATGPGDAAGPDAGHRARCLRVHELARFDISDRAVADTDAGRARDIVLAVEHLDVFYGARQVVHDVSFDLARQEVVALVGESGSGKTTTSRCIGGLHRDWTGTIALDGAPLATTARQRAVDQRKRVQYIFQNPYLSLNPRRTVEQILLRPLELFGVAHGRAARDRARDLLAQVQLDGQLLRMRAGGLSGGERQRVAIARALAAEPDVLVCDEVTSALDVSIQGAIAELLRTVTAQRGVSMVFVTHDLALTRSVADRILVLQGGRVVESGLTAQVLDHPRHDYTRDLLAHTPVLDGIR